MSHLNKYQQDWAWAKARVEAARELQSKSHDAPFLYEKYGKELVAALEDFAIATKALLVFAREVMARKFEGRPELPKVLALYDHPIQEYLNVDTLPTHWASKLVDSTMRTNFNN